MRRVNSSARSPENTRWVWESTNPGSTHRPPASMRSSATAPDLPTAMTLSPSTTTDASAMTPSGPVPREGSLVTSSEMLSITSVMVR